jgi:uncharacterized SAM-dependent methyltransferase
MELALKTDFGTSETNLIQRKNPCYFYNKQGFLLFEQEC